MAQLPKADKCPKCGNHGVVYDENGAICVFCDWHGEPVKK